MTFWLDAQMPPALAQHLATTFGIEAIPVRDLGLRDALNLLGAGAALVEIADAQAKS